MKLKDSEQKKYNDESFDFFEANSKWLRFLLLAIMFFTINFLTNFFADMPGNTVSVPSWTGPLCVGCAALAIAFSAGIAMVTDTVLASIYIVVVSGIILITSFYALFGNIFLAFPLGLAVMSILATIKLCRSRN